MKNRLFVVVLLTTVSCSVQAEWAGGVGYTNISDSADGIDISLNALTGTFGYAFAVSEIATIVPEIRVGFGIGDDSVEVFGLPADVKLKSLVAVSVRAQFDYASGLYVYLQPSYANLDLEVSSMGLSGSEDAWEFGLGGGMGYNFSDRLGAELGYESFDGTNVISAGLRFQF
ncbi:MAG: outer membrane beta-barrel protein [Pseudomonadota bacterium]